MDPAALASLAQQFEQSVAGLIDQVDASWQPRADAAWAPLRAVLVNPRMQAQLFGRLCGPLPPLTALAGPVAALVLRPREHILARLAVLALLGRPGAVRCCVQRASRTALAALLGPAWAPLRELSAGSEAVSADVAGRTPLEWSWLGYQELCAARMWPHRSLRRMARLAMPATAKLSRTKLPHSRRPVDERLSALQPLFEGRLPW